MSHKEVFLDIENFYRQFKRESFDEKTENAAKKIFCPICGRNVPLSFVVAGLCKDCFNND